MDAFVIAPNQSLSTGIHFYVDHWLKDQTNRTFSWRKNPVMTESILIRHPLTGHLIEIDPSQEWFWTKEWQLAEQKVDKELAAGKYEDFESIDDFFAEI